jgi:putative ABC transport system permease protein
VHRIRLVLTALAIALGTSFMAGTFVFTSSLTHGLDSVFAQAATGTDLIVQHTPPRGVNVGAGSASSKPVEAATLAGIKRLGGVAAASGVVSGRAALLGKDGKPLPAQFAVALSWPYGAPFQAIFTGRTGRPPAGPGQVMIDRDSARSGHFAPGDRIEIMVGGQAMPFTVSGITGYGSAPSIGGGSMAIFDLRTAQRLFGLVGRYSQIDISANHGVSPQRLRAVVAKILPPGAEVVTAVSAEASQARQLNHQLRFLTYFFGAFAGVALFVGAFVIWNTFSIMIGQRMREMALLRALGARRTQVFRSVLGEALVLGTVAAAAGVLLGIGLARGLAALLASFGVALPVTGLSLPPAGLAASFAAGLAITVLAAIPPAWRATKVAPIQALRDAVAEPSDRAAGAARRLATGLSVIAAGLALMVGGLSGHAPAAVTAAGAGAAFLGFGVLGPLYVRPLAFVVGLPVSGLPGRTGALARDNAMRNPHRTSATAAALMIGLALIVASSILVSSVRSVVLGQIASNSKTSFYIQATSTDAGITPAVARTAARVPGIRGVTQVRRTDATVAGSAHQNVDGIDPAAIVTFTGLSVRAGSLASLRSGALLVSEAVANGHHWRTGERVTIAFGSYGISRLRIGGTFAHGGPLSPYLLSTATFTADTGIRTDNVDLVRAPASVRPALQRALAPYPGAQLLSESGYAKRQGAALANILNLITALLVLAVLIALLGVVNTLALSVVERTRELGLLRAIGMRRGQLGQMIAAESVIIAGIGAVLGAALGIGLGSVLAAAFTTSQQLTVVIPIGNIVAYVVVAALAGLLAGVTPARRAARMNMLTAITSE